MDRVGLSFFIPTKANEIVKVTNFVRLNESISGDGAVGLYELNKSDYLFQTIILFIVRKIKNSNKDETNALYKLIDDIESLAMQIYLYELKELDINIDKETIRDINDEYILLRSRDLANICINERIFEYDE